MADSPIERVRRFNRTVTQRVGALEDSYLSRSRPLGQARLLWELGGGPVQVRALRGRLDLDSGYLSRLLRALESDGLVAVEADPDDGRVRTARLTAAGHAERAELDRRSDELAGAILQPLNADQRGRLVAAMAEVERLLTASTVRITVTGAHDPAARRSLAAYFAELVERFPGGFEPGRSVNGAADDLSPPAGLMLVATLHDDPVGCAGLHFGDGYAQVKRMWVAPGVRGLGLGRRLLAELEAQASAHGRDLVRLETHQVLAEAVALYRKAGYEEVAPFNAEPYAHHWFEKRLTVDS